MSISLTSPYLQFTLDPQKATWSLHGSHPEAPSIDDVWMQVQYRAPLSALLRTGKRRHKSLHDWPKAQIHGPVEVASPHGKLQQITVETGPDEHGLFYKIEFALPDEHPIFLWRLTVDNRSKYPVEIEHLTLMQAGFFPKRRLLPDPGPLAFKFRNKPVGYGAIRPHPDPGDLAFFSNGWQSWSFTGTLDNDQKYPLTRLGFLGSPIWYNPGTPHIKRLGHFGSDMFGVLGDRQHRTGILAGFLSQKQHFGSLEAQTDSFYPALALWANGDQTILEPGGQMSTDWAAIQFVQIDHPDPLAPYLEAVAREHALPAFSSITGRGKGLRLGWCSWYQYFQDISAEKMMRNLKAAGETQSSLPLDLFQIDDGFEAQVGDWLEFSPGFPEGVAPLACEIREAGFTPGLWLAPFIVHSKAKLKRQHPDWLLRNRVGRPVNAGFVWNNLNTALDLTHPEALEYTREVVHTAAHQWGFSFLKLDFLYAAALNCRYRDRTKTRAQVLRMGLETIREAAGSDVHLLGCGVPLGSAIGLFDSMRIGPDVDQRWKPYIKRSGTFLNKEFSVPSARNAIQNTLTRTPLHLRWWISDPDCLLVRSDSLLTLAEVRSLATAIALTGGPLLLSDDLLPEFPEERMRITEQLVPLIGRRGRVLDWFDETTPRLLRLDLENANGKWHLLAIFNWADEEQDLSVTLKKLALPTGEYLAREFWQEEITRISGGTLTLKDIPAHGVKLLALRPAQTDLGCYLGSDLHISQGLEVSQWSVTPKNLRMRLEKPGKAQGHIDLFLPRPPERTSIQQKEIACQPLGEGIYRLPVDFEQVAEIEIV
jgi:alpha-galactosidase